LVADIYSSFSLVGYNYIGRLGVIQGDGPQAFEDFSRITDEALTIYPVCETG